MSCEAHSKSARETSLTIQVDVVGSVDSGIKAAAWSPDEEQLIIVTGKSTP